MARQQRRNGTREGLIRHLCQTCGLDRKTAERMAPKDDMPSSRRSLDASELRRYEEAVHRVYGGNSRRTDARTRAVLLLLPEIGLRVSEVMKLDIRDVELRNGRPVSLRVLGKGNKNQPHGKLRTVRLSQKAQALLGHWLERRGSRSGPLFLGPGGGKFTPASIREAMRKIGRVSGITGMNPANRREHLLTPHMLRHTAATQAVMRCEDPKLVQAMLGHGKPGSSIRLSKTTLTYLDV